MKKGFRIEDQHAIYFLTFTTVYWIDAFTRPVYKDLLIKTLEFYREQRGIIIYAYVIMSNHIHLIIRSPKTEVSGFIRDYKKWTSRQMIELIQSGRESRRKWMLNLFRWAGERNPNNKEFQVWQQRSHPIMIFSEKFAKQKLRYIHQNPVKAQLVSKPEDYVYSSASNYAGLGGVIEVSFLDDLGGEG